MLALMVKSMFLGLSTGVFCLGYCLPFTLPLFLAQKNSFENRVKIIIKFCFGKLLAYLIIGGLSGYLGKIFLNKTIHKIIPIIIIICSVILIFYGLGKKVSQFKFCLFFQKFPLIFNLPFVFGFFAGFNICPPFIIAITYIFNIGKVFDGILFFFIFFLTTSIYFIPLIFIGYFSKFEKIQWISQLFAVMSGIIFFLIGISRILLKK